MLSIVAQSKAFWKRNETDVLIAAAFILMAFLAYTAGSIGAASRSSDQITIRVPDSASTLQQQIEGAAPLAQLATDTDSDTGGIPIKERKGEYVASKNGSYYYAADMAAALRIKSENRIWFNAPQEAEARGLKPAKGL
ncbi:MAG: hypothetical protein Q8Q39_02665 [bacterium]|nr:hypothetical protein [bacterium]